MRRLPIPNIDFKTSLSESISGVANAIIRNNYHAQIANPAAIEAAFGASAQAALLYSFPRIAHGIGDVAVHGSLTKSDLIKLYTQYFVPKEKPARRLYEQLKITANEKCPFCGDIGHVHTLDHYLPKANFPLYSVMPGNMIPCCRDCNSEKLNAFSATAEGQTLHPYFDDDKFFGQQWIYGRVIQGSPPVIEYYVCPPEYWSPEDKSRVIAHFIEYRLPKRFGVEAAADLPETIMTRKSTLQNLSPKEYSDYLGEKSNNLNLPVNNWRRVMFSCLASDSWFCENNH
ncbi:MAG: HNH endonuclease signature motif containing protein [Sphingorhabdus sp.]